MMATSPAPSADCSMTRGWPPNWAAPDGSMYNADFPPIKWRRTPCAYITRWPSASDYFGFSRRAADRQLLECLRSPASSGSFRGAAEILLPSLRENDRLVRQHSAGELRRAGRALPPLP